MPTKRSDSSADPVSDISAAAGDKKTMEKREDEPKLITFGDCHSTDPNNPDIIEVTPETADIFQTEQYSYTYVRDEAGRQRILPLHYYNSNNFTLETEWNRGFARRRIRIGRLVKIQTHLGISRNNRDIRRFTLVI